MIGTITVLAKYNIAFAHMNKFVHNCKMLIEKAWQLLCLQDSQVKQPCPLISDFCDCKQNCLCKGSTVYTQVSMLVGICCLHISIHVTCFQCNYFEITANIAIHVSIIFHLNSLNHSNMVNYQLCSLITSFLYY